MASRRITSVPLGPVFRRANAPAAASPAQPAGLADVAPRPSISCDTADDAKLGSEATRNRNTNRASCPMCGSDDLKVLFRRQYRNRDYSLARCRICGQHFCDPSPSAQAIAGFYGGAYHEPLRTEGATEKAFGAKFAEYRDWVTEFIAGGRTLDIGTATGLMPALLKQAGFDAEGIEFNEASAKWGEEHYNVRIRVGDINHYRDELGAFDFISMTDVLEHAPHPLNFLEAVSVHLKPGGWMLVTFPDIQSVESRYAFFWSKLLRRDWIWHCCHIPAHVWEFTPATARAMFNQAGLEVIAFRRRAGTAKLFSGVLKVPFLPALILQIPAIGNAFGTQMQFMLRKRS